MWCCRSPSTAATIAAAAVPPLPPAALTTAAGAALRDLSAAAAAASLLPYAAIAADAAVAPGRRALPACCRLIMHCQDARSPAQPLTGCPTPGCPAAKPRSRARVLLMLLPSMHGSCSTSHSTEGGSIQAGLRNAARPSCWRNPMRGVSPASDERQAGAGNHQCELHATVHHTTSLVVIQAGLVAAVRLFQVGGRVLGVGSVTNKGCQPHTLCMSLDPNASMAESRCTAWDII